MGIIFSIQITNTLLLNRYQVKKTSKSKRKKVGLYPSFKEYPLLLSHSPSIASIDGLMINSGIILSSLGGPVLYFIFTFTITCIALYGIAALFPEFSLIRALPYSILILISIQCTAFGLLSFFGIGFNGTLGIVVNGLICLACLTARKITSRHDDQEAIKVEKPLSDHMVRRIGSREDVVGVAFIALFMAIISILHFGPSLSLSFVSGDSASHCASILRYASGEPVSGQYVFGLSGAYILNAMHSLVGPDNYATCYVLTEIFWCWLSMQMFYSLISCIKCNLNIAVKLILCALYAFGYPFYSTIMGFGYFGASIAIVCALLFTFMCLSLATIRHLAMLSLLLTELSVGYLLFVPPIFFTSFILVILTRSAPNPTMPMRIASSFVVLLIPCLFALFLNYRGFFFSGDVSTISASADLFSSALSRDGGTLKILFADFIFIAPLALYGFISQACNKEHFLRLGLFPSVFVLYCIALFMPCLLNIVSPYYFYKTYAILWLIFFLLTALGIDQLRIESYKALVAYACIWTAILFLALTGLDAKLAAKRPDLDTTPISDQLFPLYRYNSMKIPLIFDENALHQFRSANVDDIPDDQITSLTSPNEMKWLRVFGFGSKPLYWWDAQYADKTLDTQTILDHLQDSEYIYIGDSFYSRPYPNADYTALDETAEYIAEHYRVLFETDYGTLYCLNDSA